MRTRLFRIKLALTAVVCLAALLFVCTDEAATQSGGALSEQEKRGKQIYLKGEGDSGPEIMAGLGSDELDLPATAFACVNCHGRKGEGTQEGGLQPPPLTWEKLTRPQVSPLTRRERIAYNEVSVARAVSDGLDPLGRPLHPGMPHYRMTAIQMVDLIAYLKKLGSESDAPPGVGESTIRIGAALPLTGPLSAIGEDVKATLRASFDQINARGGIYNRRFELVVEDSRGEPSQTVEATRRLIEQDGVFALVGSFEPGDSSSLNELIKRNEIPLLGPVTLSPKLATPPNPFVFYLLPTFSDQARALVDFVHTKTVDRRAQLAVIYADNDFSRDALAGLQAQARMYSMELVAEHGYPQGHFDAPKAVELLARKKPGYLFFFGDADDLNACAKEIERAGLNLELLSSVVMIGRGAFKIPAGQAARTFLAYPSALPDKDGFAEFMGIMQQARVQLRSPAFQSVAFAAAEILFEAAKLSGRQLDRPTLIASLEKMRDFETGVVPPVTFGPNRRVGSLSSYIVGIDLEHSRYTTLSGRLIPKERP